MPGSPHFKERLKTMDKDNFNFVIGDHLVDMTNGELTIDGSGYDPGDSQNAFTYAIVRRCAFESGVINNDDDIPAVIWDAI
jgi:hypothetical protein